MNYNPGDTVYTEFITSSSTGAATNADSTPTGTVNKNGTDDGAVSVTVTNIDTGRYKATFAIPTSYVGGDVVVLSISAAVSSVTGKAVIFNQKIGPEQALRCALAQSGSNVNTIKLDSAASATNNLYNGLTVIILSGTGAGQARTIIGYNGTSKQASVDRQFTTAPDNTSVFALLATDSPTLNANLQVATASNTIAIRTGTAQSGSTSTTIKLDSGASSTDNIYNSDIVTITGGTGLGQTRTILSYVGSTKVANVDRAWTTTPDGTSTFAIYASLDAQSYSDQGMAQAGGATSITLAATASATSNIYNGSLITIITGTGSGQTNEITAYNGSTKVATVANAWSVNPDSTSYYAVIPSQAQSTPPTPPTPAQIWAQQGLGSKAMQQKMEYIVAAVAGKVSGAGSGTEVFLGNDGSTTVLTNTVDAAGNRSAITYGV